MLHIVIDSREQNPFPFVGFDCQTQRGTLNTGDYSLLGFEDNIAIERKSLGDLVGCLTSDRERFLREMERLRGYESCVVVVESSWNDLCRGDYHSKLNINSAIQSVISITQKYRMPFYFANNRPDAELYTYNFIRHYWRHAVQRYSALEKNQVSA